MNHDVIYNFSSVIPWLEILSPVSSLDLRFSIGLILKWESRNFALLTEKIVSNHLTIQDQNNPAWSCNYSFLSNQGLLFWLLLFSGTAWCRATNLELFRETVWRVCHLSNSAYLSLRFSWSWGSWVQQALCLESHVSYLCFCASCCTWAEHLLEFSDFLFSIIHLICSNLQFWLLNVSRCSVKMRIPCPELLHLKYAL